MSTPAGGGGQSYGEYSTDDENQLQPNDTLDDRGVADVLDEGYSPPERWSAAERYGNTPDEALAGESLDQRLAQEDPEPDPYDDGDDAGGEAMSGDDFADADSGNVRSGRLVSSPDDGYGGHTDSDVFADDVGIDGAAASAEEAAVHVVEEDE